MQRIEKKHIKRMNCPKCQRPKLRFAHSADGVEPDGVTGPQLKLRCDICKIDYREGDAAIQKELAEVISHVTPMPVSVRR